MSSSPRVSQKTPLFFFVDVGIEERACERQNFRERASRLPFLSLVVSLLTEALLRLQGSNIYNAIRYGVRVKYMAFSDTSR